MATAETQLANAESKRRELSNHKNLYDNEPTRRSTLTVFISEQMTNGLSYDEAWAKAKLERSEIFANMARK